MQRPVRPLNPTSTRGPASPVVWCSWLLALCALCGQPAMGQARDLAPVAVDDSPVAERALDEATSQARDNPKRTSELAADLLDEYGDRVVARADDPEVFESVRSRVIELLLSEPAVLAVWQREENLDAERMLAEEGADAVFRRRPLTTAGLEAGLRIAQRLIETGRAGGGLGLLGTLESWPDASSADNRFGLLRALALVDLARREPLVVAARDQSITQLAARDPEAARRLRSIVDAPMSEARSPGPPSVESIRDRDWTSLWRLPLTDSLFLRKTTDIATGRVLSRSNQATNFTNGNYLVTVPTVIDDLVLVNEGFLIQAMDRYTGRLRWFREYGNSRGIMPSGFPGDLNEIVIADGEAYTVLGHGFGNDRAGDGTVIRFDPATGRERWRVRPDRMADDPQLEDAEVSGPPLVVGDLLVLPLRKLTTRFFTIDLVLALDRTDGRFRWLRTIASSGSVRSAAGRPVARLAEMDGDVIVTSAAGGIARLDGRTGEVRWLRRDEVPLRLFSRGSNLCWEIGGPVVCDRGIATLNSARSRWLLLDPDDGSLISSRPVGIGTIAGQAGWFMVIPGVLDGRDLLLAIGRDNIVALDPARPDRQVWNLREMSATAEEPALSSTWKPAGRVFALADGIVVPFESGLRVVEGLTGRASRILSLPGPSNPVVTEDGIYTAGSRMLGTAMPIAEAIAALEARIRNAPDAIPQALALLELSERLERWDLVRFAAESAVAASQRLDSNEWRDEVLDRLLLVVGRTGQEDGTRLIALAKQLATEPAQRIRLDLVQGDWLVRQGRPLEAARAWLGVVDQQVLDSIEVSISAGVWADGSLAAASRLRALYESNPAVEERIALEGRTAVDQAIEERAEATRLIALARRHAGSESAFMAASRAIEVLRDEGRPELATAVAAVIARGFDRSDPLRNSLLLQGSEAVADSGRPDLARMLARSAGEGLESVSARTQRRPSLPGVPDRSELISGVPVLLSDSAARTAPTDGILMVSAPSENEMLLAWRRASDLEPVWELVRPTASTEVIAWDPAILLWEGGDGASPRLTAIDRTDGAILWSTPRMTELMPPSTRLMVSVDGFMPDGTAFMANEILPRMSEGGILLVRRDGGISCIDPVDGRTPVWSRRGLMDRVYGADLVGGLLHVWGASIDEDGAKVGRVVSLDPVNGQSRSQARFPDGEVRRVLGDDSGRLAVLTTTRVNMLDPMGRMLGASDGWYRDDRRLASASVGWMSEDQLVLVDEDGDGTAIDPGFGTTIPGVWELAEDGERQTGRLLESRRLGNRRLLRYDARVLLYDSAGSLVGADGIARKDRSNWATMPTQEGVLVFSRAPRTARLIHRVHRLDDQRGLLAADPPFDLEGRFDGVSAIDGWLLLHRLGMTFALPMAEPAGVMGDKP